MAFVYPFRGYRYNKEIVKDINRVVVQPYDKITTEMQEEYYRRSPYNAVRVTLNLEKQKNPNTEYSEAASTLSRWIGQKVLLRDDSPAIYAYYQEYIHEDKRKLQKGFIALLDLKGSEAGIIPHERTLQAPKQDRLQLLRSTENNEDSVFMLYSDKSLVVNRIMDESISNRIPDIEARDDFGVIHKLWAITETGKLKNIQNAMQKERLFIADGHHRFETSLNFMKECEQRNWSPAGPESFDKRMVTCFNIDFKTPLFLENIQNHFEVRTVDSREILFKEMNQEYGRNVFGFYPSDTKKFYLLALKEEAQNDSIFDAYIEEYRRLDVSILHILILEQHLGINESKLVSQSHVDYARDVDRCIEAVNAGKYQAAFFLNPTTSTQMQSLALKGERMPQKSTDFYPKLLTGFVFMKMKINKNV